MTRTMMRWSVVVMISGALALAGCSGTMSGDGMMKKDDSMMKKDGMAGDKGMMKDDKGMMEKK